MSRTTMALIVKFIMTFLAAWIIFGVMLDNPLSHVLLLSALGTAINYLLGDLMVLPKFGNAVASVGDGVMAALTAYILDMLIPVFETTFTALILFTLAVAAFEYFFHQYLLKDEKVAPNKD
ncbi:DUF2512 family protein [Peptococcaceae bacterium 1198_IL3148]